MASKRKFSLLTALVTAVLSVFASGWVLAQVTDDRSVLGSIAANSVNGLIAPIGLTLIVALLIKKRSIAAAVSFSCTLLYLVLSGQVVWNPDRSSTDSLRVMTFNIEHGRHGIAKIAELVRHEDVDAFAFQECGTGTDKDVIEELRRLLPDYHIFAEGSRTSGTRLPVLRERAIPLDNLPYSWTAVEQIVQFGDRTIRILNVHSPSYIPELTLKKPKGYWVRRWPEVAKEQTDLIESELRIIAESDVPTVLCGDFNMASTGRRYRLLADQAQDCYLKSGKGLGWTSPAAFPMRRIDYVWAFPGVKPHSCRVVNWLASDHAAVVADLALAE